MANISAKKASSVDVRTDTATIWAQLCLDTSIACHVAPDSQVTARRVHVVPAREALMQIAAPNRSAHHAILVHTLRYKVLHQILAKSALKGRMLQHQAPTNVLTVLQAVFAMKLDFLSTESALLGDTPTSSHDGTAPPVRLVAIRKPKAQQSAQNVMQAPSMSIRDL